MEELLCKYDIIRFLVVFNSYFHLFLLLIIYYFTDAALLVFSIVFDYHCGQEMLLIIGINHYDRLS